MKHLKKDVWQNDAGHDLLEKVGPDKFYIPCSFLKLARLAELREAIDDALRREQVLANVNGRGQSFAEQVEAAVASEA